MIMAKMDSSQRLIKVLTPDMISQALAEWLLRRQNICLNQWVRVELQFSFNRAARELTSVRMEIEVN